MRLAKYLAMTGAASRRRAEEIITQGRVRVNGVVVQTPAFNVDPEYDEVICDGQNQYPENKLYLLLYKPAGYISSVVDPQGRPTVMDLVKDINERVYPVGRLDFDTEGLLLMSNDGEFANLMIHPRYQMNKTYEAWVKGRVGQNTLAKLAGGIVLDDGVTAPAGVRLLREKNGNSLLEIMIHEGRKRQVRRMCAAVGHEVIHLKRTAFAALTLKGLQPGGFRHLSNEEIEDLIRLARGADQK